MAKRKAPRTHFLIAGDSIDLPLLAGIASRLPIDAYGQVFVEVEHPMQVEAWSLPDNIAVSWLVREGTEGMSPRGELLAGAVNGWVSEWMPDAAALHEAPYVIWIGCSASEYVGELADDLSQRLEIGRPHS
ncbi:MAG: SIP domain-containing protein [Pseudoclavibacter sp.]